MFSSTILVGLVTGAAPSVLIPRAVQGMLCGVGLGLAAGWIGMHIIRDGLVKEEEPEAAHHEAQAKPDDHHGDVTVVGG